MVYDPVRGIEQQAAKLYLHLPLDPAGLLLRIYPQDTLAKIRKSYLQVYSLQTIGNSKDWE